MIEYTPTNRFEIGKIYKDTSYKIWEVVERTDRKVTLSQVLPVPTRPKKMTREIILTDAVTEKVIIRPKLGRFDEVILFAQKFGEVE